MTRTTKNYHEDTVPILSGWLMEDDGTDHRPLGVGMAWEPGGDLATEQLQQEEIRIRLHLPADPAETDFQVQFSLDQDFADTTRTSDPAASAVTFTVTDEVAEYQVDEFDSETGSNTYVFAEMPGQTMYVRVRRSASDPWSRTVHFTPYYPSADDNYAASGMPNPVPQP